MNQSGKVLFITQISPFPITGGEQLRSYGLIRMLSNLGIDTTAIIDARSKNVPEIPHIRFRFFDFRKLPTRFHFINTFSIFRKNSNLVGLIEDCLANEQYDTAIIDYLFYGQYIRMLKKRNIRVIYGTHNAQAKLYLQRKATGLKTWIYIRLDFVLQTLHERLYFPRADALIVVSGNDLPFYKRFIQPSKVVVIPNMIEKTTLDLNAVQKENHLVMTANFHAFQNIAGLEWFVREVWNEELSRVTSLKLFGYGSLKFFEQLRQKLPCPGIVAMGEVENIKPYIASARISIVPLLDGGGTRLKCLEAMSLKTQLISTTKGCEGIEHESSIVTADTASDFRQRILDVISGKLDTVQEAYRVYESKYSLKPNQRILLRLITNKSE
jgi:glycosyltransferase involved in cell wall biosynthesis